MSAVMTCPDGETFTTIADPGAPAVVFTNGPAASPSSPVHGGSTAADAAVRGFARIVYLDAGQDVNVRHVHCEKAPVPASGDSRMRRRWSFLASLTLACTLGAAPPAAPEHGIGSVHMDISCGADANARFDRGLALLHNFWYERALTEFDAVIAAHPDCAIAYWGAAMTYNHPLWSPPTGTDVKAALAVLERAKGAGTRNDREAKYVAAVVTLFGDGDSAKKDARDVTYRDAMRAI